MAPIAMVSAAVHADPAASPAPSKSKAKAAKAYVDAGLVAQKAGDYDTAITLYTKAYELVPHPVLVFNMAQAHRLAGRVERALNLYRKYLEEAPRGSEARTARELIAEIEALKAGAEREAKAAHDAEAADPPGGPRKARRMDVADEAHRPREARETGESRESGDGDGARESGESTKAGKAGKTGKERTVASRGDAPSDTGDREPPDTTGPEAAAQGDRHGDRVIAWVGAGASFAQRALTYDTRQNFPEAPPQVQTSAPAVHIAGEIYPIALSDRENPLAGLGIVAVYDKTVAATLRQGDATEAPVDQAYYQIGVRYRLGIGTSTSVAIGLDSLHRHYRFDRAAASGPALIDAPDVNYAALSPVVGAQLAVTPTITLFAQLGVPLVYDAGAIQEPKNYGKATVYGVETFAGLSTMLGSWLNLRVAVEYSRFQLTFAGMGEMSNGRDGDATSQDVTGAVDRSIGITAILGVTY
jgi:tetratricopeptide (TPR) repeat protein